MNEIEELSAMVNNNIDSISFLLAAINRLQSDHIKLQETVFSLQSRLYEIEAVQDHEPLTQEEMKVEYGYK